MRELLVDDSESKRFGKVTMFSLKIDGKIVSRVTIPSDMLFNGGTRFRIIRRLLESTKI